MLGRARALCKAFETGVHSGRQPIKELIQAGKLDDAIDTMARACSLEPEYERFHFFLGHLYSAKCIRLKAFHSFRDALLVNPTSKRDQDFFCRTIPACLNDSFSEETKEAIALCLENPDFPHEKVSKAWHSLIWNNPDYAPLTALADSKNFSEFSASINLEELSGPLQDNYLLFGLRRLLIEEVRCERLMTFLRRYFLQSDDYDPKTFLPFLCVLSEQCSVNEYIFEISSKEETLLASLEGSVEIPTSLDHRTMSQIALLACYKSLHRTKYAADLGKAAGETHYVHFQNIVELQIHEPQKIATLLAAIDSHSPITNHISLAVQKQYEENPYPRWRQLDVPFSPDEVKGAGKGKDILVAGCGTGLESSRVAMRYPNAQILAIDLSGPSLAYGNMRALEAGVSNLSFMHADILDLESIEKKFDLIHSTGVLHHMEDPVRGWSKLLSCLKPDGVVRIALYSEIARQNKQIASCRAWIKELGLQATAEGIREFRRLVLELDLSSPWRAFSSLPDFFSVAMCRDLFFHVQEHCFTFLELKKILCQLNLQLVEMNLSDPKVLNQYRSMFPSDPNALDFDNWHEYEQQFPNTFIEMYFFSCTRKGAPVELPDWI